MASATDKQQLLDEVFFLGQDKKFVLNFNDFLKASVPFQKVENKLLKKRKAYNYAFANVLKKYRLCPDDLYSELDRLWTSAEKILKKVDESRAVAAAWGAGGVAGVAVATGLSVVSGGVGGVAVALGVGAAEANRVRQVWNTYLASTLALAQRLTTDDTTPAT